MMNDSIDISLMLKSFNQHKTLTTSEEEAIRDSMEIEVHKKGSTLIKEGQAHANSYFVLKGCIREFSLVNSKEYTSHFYTEGEWIIVESASAVYELVCLEECTLVKGNETKAQALFGAFPELEVISRKLVESSFMESQKNQLEFRSLSPEDRYLKMMETRASLFQRVPLYLIADYLGIKPESLSRIRKRLAKS